jgi:hypothetical protein
MLSLDYCNTLLTSIQRLVETFTPHEINVLYERVVVPTPLSQTVKKDFIEQCHDISTFYVFIAHLYAVVILTINPKHKYNPTSHYNHLQPVVPSLNHLYMDDEYDIITEKFQGMSPLREVQFNDDLHNFYLLFTGNSVVPSTIQRFDDILLKDYSKTYSDEIISNSPDLFETYAKYIQKMLTYSNHKQGELFCIIRQLFHTPVLIHPKLSLQQLVGLVSHTRNTIIQLYVECERDVNEIATIYDALIKKGELDNIIHQYKCIQQIINNIDM